MTDPVRGENPVWTANYKKKNRCLTAHTVINVEGIFKSPQSNKVIKEWKKGDTLSVDWVVNFNTITTCTKLPCTGPTGLLQPTCRDLFFRENTAEWFSPPGESLVTAPYQMRREMKYKVGCCSKKCASKKGTTESNFNFTLSKTYTANSNFKEGFLGGGIGSDFKGNAIGSIAPEGDAIEIWEEEIFEEFCSAAGIKPNSKIALDGSEDVSYYVEIIPDGLLDKNFKRPCNE